jgi:hypothetical protein
VSKVSLREISASPSRASHRAFCACSPVTVCSESISCSSLDLWFPVRLSVIRRPSSSSSALTVAMAPLGAKLLTMYSPLRRLASSASLLREPSSSHCSASKKLVLPLPFEPLTIVAEAARSMTCSARKPRSFRCVRGGSRPAQAPSMLPLER